MKFLIVDDNQTGRRALASAIMSGPSKASVDSVSTLTQALTRLQKGRYDGILCDVQRADSIDPAFDIAQLMSFTDAPVIFMSATVEEWQRRSVMESGASGYLAKHLVTGPLLEDLFLNAGYVRRPGLNGSGQSGEAMVQESLDDLSLTVETAIMNAQIDGDDQRSNWLAPLGDTVAAIRELAGPAAQGAQVSVSMRRAFSMVRDDIRTAANARDVELEVHGLDGTLTSTRSGLAACLGLKFLLAGLVLSARRTSRLMVVFERHDDAMEARATFSDKNVDFEVFERIFRSPDRKSWAMSEAQLALGLAVRLLGLKEADVRRATNRHSESFYLSLSPDLVRTREAFQD